MGERRPGLDVTTANVARMWDFYLGGKDNYAVDRQAVEQVLAAAPEAARMARQIRQFLGRAVHRLAEQGIRQFLDLGTGLPTRQNVHQVAQQVCPQARVVYVDNDPVVLGHARALLANSDDQVAVVEGDLRDPAAVLSAPETTKLLDPAEPTGVLFVSVLHFLTDAEDPAGVVRAFMAPMAPGSHVVISHATAEVRPQAARRAAAVYDRASAPMVQRPGAQIEAWFAGLDLLEPGVVPVTEWPIPSGPGRGHRWHLAGVGRKR